MSHFVAKPTFGVYTLVPRVIAVDTFTLTSATEDFWAVDHVVPITFQHCCVTEATLHIFTRGKFADFLVLSFVDHVFLTKGAFFDMSVSAGASLLRIVSLSAMMSFATRGMMLSIIARRWG